MISGGRERYLDVPRLPESGPIDLLGIAGGRSPIEMDIGFGRGRFLLDRARVEPSRCLLGIETRLKWVHLALERAKARGLDNVVARRGDARESVGRMEPDGSVSNVFVSFPDPWWKARHAKRRLLDSGFVAQLVRLLDDGGDLFVQTDVEARADAYRDLLEGFEDLAPAGEGGRIDENPYGARSSREIRCEDLGLEVHRLLFRRRGRG